MGAIPEFHPLADLFPMLEQDRLQELADDIRQHGLRNPIVLYQGKVLDGRNRIRACALAGVDPMASFDTFTGPDPLALVVSLNLHRRHLDTGQRAAVAVKIANTSHGGSRKDQDRKSDLDRTQTEAAKIMDVSTDSVRVAAKVRRKSPETFAKLETGEISLAAAERAVDGERGQKRPDITLRSPYLPSARAPEPTPAPAVIEPVIRVTEMPVGSLPDLLAQCGADPATIAMEIAAVVHVIGYHTDRRRDGKRIAAGQAILTLLGGEEWVEAAQKFASDLSNWEHDRHKAKPPAPVPPPLPTSPSDRVPS